MPHIARADGARLMHRAPWFGDGVYRAPVGAVEVDATHFLASNLAACYVFGANSALGDIVGGNSALAPVNLAATGWMVSAPGIGIALSGSENTGPSGARSIAEPVSLETTTAATLGAVLVANQGATGNTASYVAVTKSAGAIWQYSMGVTTSGTANVFWATSTSASSFSNGTGITQHVPLAVAASFIWGGTGAYYQNGVQIYTYAMTGTPVYDSTTRLEVGSNQADTTRQCQGSIAAAFVWNRALSASELTAFTLDPFSMLRPAILRDRKALASGAGSLGLLHVGR